VSLRDVHNDLARFSISNRWFFTWCQCGFLGFSQQAMVLVLCCSATIRFSAIVVFLAGLPSGHGQTAWKTIDQKVKSGFSGRLNYPIFCLPTGVFYTSSMKDHPISVAFFSMTAPFVVK